MSLLDIVYCYVKETIPAPDNFERLRESFLKNGYTEKIKSQDKRVYSRGAKVALEFNYNSEAIEMQVVLENKGNDLMVSVGNWGFPFEPLMMKNRFKKNLADIVRQITENGELAYDQKSVSDIKHSASQKKNWAFIAIAAAIALVVLTYWFDVP